MTKQEFETISDKADLDFDEELFILVEAAIDSLGALNKGALADKENG